MTYAIIDIRENLAFEYHFESVENPKLVEITAPWFLEKLKFSTPNGLRATVSGLRPTESRWKKNNEKKKSLFKWVNPRFTWIAWLIGSK